MTLLSRRLMHGLWKLILISNQPKQSDLQTAYYFKAFMFRRMRGTLKYMRYFPLSQKHFHEPKYQRTGGCLFLVNVTCSMPAWQGLHQTLKVWQFQCRSSSITPNGRHPCTSLNLLSQHGYFSTWKITSVYSFINRNNIMTRKNIISVTLGYLQTRYM